MDHQTLKFRDVIAVLVAITFPTLAAWLYFVAMAGQESVRLAYSVSKVIQFAFPLFWVWAIQRTPVRPELPGQRGVRVGLYFGVFVLALLLTAYYGYFRSSVFLVSAPEFIWIKLKDMGADTTGKFLALAVFITLLHSLLEEYYWRWFVFGQLRRKYSFGPAMLISSLGFMAHHVIIISNFLKPEHWLISLFFSLCVAVGGGVWAWIYERTRSLYGPWASHMLVDAGLMAVGFDLCKGYWP